MTTAFPSCPNRWKTLYRAAILETNKSVLPQRVSEVKEAAREREIVCGNATPEVLSDHAVANTWWDPSSLPNWLTEQCYVEQIQPPLRGKKVREIGEAMQVSGPYAAFVRSGRRRPHPRHWRALAALAGFGNDEQLKRKSQG